MDFLWKRTNFGIPNEINAVRSSVPTKRYDALSDSETQPIPYPPRMRGKVGRGARPTVGFAIAQTTLRVVLDSAMLLPPAAEQPSPVDPD